MKTYMANLLIGLLVFQPSVLAAESELKKNPSSLYKDVFDSNVYYDNTSYLHFSRLSKKLSGKKIRAANANIYDEVADSAFFTNRHNRKPLSAEQLTQGGQSSQETPGLDFSNSLAITGGHLEGLRPVFTIKDSKGDEYTLYFDSPDSLGLMTSAMVIASRAYYALGYNVPQVNLVSFAPDKLVPDENSRFVDVSGFNKKLTKEKLAELILMVPWAEDGKFRAAAVKTPDGVDKGPFSFMGRRKEDPDDRWPHERLRELRALRVFAAWLNDFNIHDQNTQDFLVSEDGKTVLKHYLMGFKGALGADTDGSKPPMVGYEYLFDAGETQKAFWTLGFFEKPWQKRWREAEQAAAPSSAMGYFNNSGFEPARFKTFLPQYIFKDLTRADAFWAAKILKSFSDDDIRALVRAGQYADSQDETFIAKTLIARRDIIAKYWMGRSAPLDDFELKNGELSFTDLTVKYGFEKGGPYEADVKTPGKNKKTASLRSEGPSFKVENAWLQIRKIRPGSKHNPFVLVKVSSKGIEEIVHED